MAPSSDDPIRKKSRGSRLLRFLGLEYEVPERRAGRTCVLLQIDGLSHEEFQRAIREGKLPFLRQLLETKQATASPWHSLLPASTGAFQIGLFYGNNDDVPGFFWYDKRARHEIHLNSVDDAAALEERTREQVAPFPGLLHHGAAYSAIFAGGARDTLLTFSRLFRPSLNVGTRPRWILYFLLTQVVLIGRLLYYSFVELLVALSDMAYGVFSQKNKYLEFRFLFPRIACVVFCREIATLAAALDIRRGVGPVYVNYLAYDEHAHHRGPSSKFAQWTLKGLDASVKRVHDATLDAEREGIRSYDLYVWSDHGQAAAEPFHERFGQDPTRHFELLFDLHYGPTEEIRDWAGEEWNEKRLGKGRLIRGLRDRRDLARIRRQADQAHQIREALPGSLQRIYDWLLRSAQDAYDHYVREEATPDAPRLKFVSTGPAAGLYLDGIEEPVCFEDWTVRFPRFLEEVAQHEGVGFALVRTRDGGAMVGAGGVWLDIDEDNAWEDHGLAQLGSLIHENRDALRRWANMTSAGDILVLGCRAAHGTLISYSYERGSHCCPTESELTPFIIVPDRAVEHWPEVRGEDTPPITLPIIHRRLRELYYHKDEPEPGNG